MMTNKTIRRMCVLAGMSALAVVASAVPVEDLKINIDRALNSPTLTVRYKGASAALVELRLNGESLGTRTVSATKSAGETSFNVDSANLKDGDNQVEIRLYDRTGKLIGTETTNIAVDQSQYGPIYLSAPKVGQEVRGSVEIKVGFGREMRNAYVSFFVNDQFKKMTNTPPFIFNWDTTGERNGWHEVEAWVVDESSTTFKTRKTRIFVNNPSGRTERQGVDTQLTTARSRELPTAEGTAAGMRVMKSTGRVKAAGAVAATTPKGAATLRRNSTVAAVGEMRGMKSVAAGGSLATGTKSITPSGKFTVAKLDKTPKLIPGPQLTSVASSSLLLITPGQRLPNIGTFAVVFNSQFVDFDVNPRVDDGVPMSPFRHLLEKSGGTVDWENVTKTVKADSEGRRILLHIGDRNALIGASRISLEIAPYIDRGRTIVPLSFLGEALNVKVEYDKETGHVLITSKKS